MEALKSRLQAVKKIVRKAKRSFAPMTRRTTPSEELSRFNDVPERGPVWGTRTEAWSRVSPWQAQVERERDDDFADKEECRLRQILTAEEERQKQIDRSSGKHDTWGDLPFSL